MKFYSKDIRRAVKSFGRELTEKTNVTIKFLKHVDGREPVAVHNETYNHPAQLVVVSYLDPLRSIVTTDQLPMEGDIEANNNTNHNLSNSASSYFIHSATSLAVPAVTLGNGIKDTLETTEYRKLTGVPEHSWGPTIGNPELGQLGTLFLKDGARRFVLIVHEPLPLSQHRKSTIV